MLLIDRHHASQLVRDCCPDCLRSGIALLLAYMEACWLLDEERRRTKELDGMCTALKEQIRRGLEE